MKRIIFLAIALIIFSANASAELITISQAVCNTPDNNQTWLAGNTYFINADANVDVVNCQLTINAGAVVKFKATPAGTTYLNVTTKGVLKAQGTSDSRIYFTSENDCSVGTTITGTSNDANCGTAAARDYKYAISFTTATGFLPDTNDFSFLTIGYAKTGFSSTTTNMLNSIHDLNVHDTNCTGIGNGSGIDFWFGKIKDFYNNNVSRSLAGAGIFVFGETITNFYNNTISNNTSISSCAGVNVGSSTITNFYNNTISNNTNSGTGGGSGVYTGTSGTITNFYNNTITNNSALLGKGAGIYNGFTITNIYNNIFKNNSAKQGGAIYNEGSYEEECTIATISNLHNNTFFDNNANSSSGGAIYNTTINYGGTKCGFINNNYNNIFSYNTGTAIANSNALLDSNFNAFYANDTNTSGYTEGTQSSYLGQTPFIDDASDRNFLYNTYGINQLQGKGRSATGTDSWFQGRTIRFDNRLDYNRSIGYHYDQNSPYLSITSPIVGTYSGTVPIDFNVSTSNGFATDITSAILKYSATQSGGTNIISQALNSYTCTGLFPSTTKDVNCTYSWNTSSMTDGNYFLLATATDANGTGTSVLANSILLSNDSQAPDMNNDANTTWQAADANVRIWCNDIAKGNNDINSIAINKDNNGWTFFSKSALSVKIADHNAFFSSTLDHNLQYFCSDSIGNTTDVNSVHVYIDKINPILNLLVTSITTNGLNAQITFTATTLSGIKKYWISKDNGATWTNNGTSTTYSFSISSATQLPYSQPVWIKATNNADQNTTIQTVTVTFTSASGNQNEYCGDLQCNAEETPATCPIDCSAICGDGACTGSETIDTCPEDCARICGDEICSASENCDVCTEDCGQCNKPLPIQGTIIAQFFQNATPNQKQITEILTQNKLEHLIQNALEIMPNFEITRTIILTQLTDLSYQTHITITVKNKTSYKLTGLAILETVPKSLAQTASEITSNNELIVLQEDPVLEFVITGQLSKETSFYYLLNKKLEDQNIFLTPIVLNQAIKKTTTCDKGCDDKNPCTKDQCINENCVYFLIPDNTPCGYAQKCRKGICLAFPTTNYQQPITIFGQQPGIIILAIIILITCTTIGIYYYKKTHGKQNSQ